MKKTLLTIAALFLVLGASSLMADTNWSGTYTGDDTGTWTGTISDAQDPAQFKGNWASMLSAEYGKLVAVLEYDGSGVYKVIKGTIYDKKGLEIGEWSGTFSLATDPGHAKGAWWQPTGTQMGSWTGQTVD